MTRKVEFTNSEGHKLAARLELPEGEAARSFALFAHCFTCNKNLTAVRNISRALNQQGIGVLRFDFTGLGESEGDFADSSFSSDVEDLVSACQWMDENAMTPEILIGHSLGGAAVVFAAKKMDATKAVVTIGAPADPSHVQHLFGPDLKDIKDKGIADVTIGGRSFTIKEEFLKDLESKNMKRVLHDLNRPILILHSPGDEIVSVANAAEIYKAARHPKSYISLDGMDHLMSEKEDSLYAGEIIATWVSRYVQRTPRSKTKIAEINGVSATLGDEGFTTSIFNGRHHFIADEPRNIGGEDLGPSPYELISAGLAACSVMTLQMYARRKKWDLKEVHVEIEHFKDYAHDYEEYDDKSARIDHLHKSFRFEGSLNTEQRQRLLEIAERCPVNKTLKSDIHIASRLAD